MAEAILCDVCGVAAPYRETEVECEGHRDEPGDKVAGLIQKLLDENLPDNAEAVVVPVHKHKMKVPPPTWMVMKSANPDAEPQDVVVCGPECAFRTIRGWMKLVDVELSDEQLQKLVRGEE